MADGFRFVEPVQPLFTLDDLSYDELYPIGRLNRIRMARGRMLNEALANDPAAPAPQQRTKMSKLYSKRQLEEYMRDYERPRVDILDLENRILEAKEEAKSAKAALSSPNIRKQFEEWFDKDVKSTIDNAINEFLHGRNVYKIDISPDTLCGVYFLVKDNAIVYVGQSVNVYARLTAHIESKDFDSIRIFECSAEDLDEYEGFFIRLLEPPLNGWTSPSGKRNLSAPMSKMWNRVRSIQADMREVLRTAQR